MPAVVADADELVARARRLASRGGRALVGITGPPGAGKSTLASDLAGALGELAMVVPMDGFHLPQAELMRLGRRDRMGAPDTFDVAGYAALLERLRDPGEGVVRAPDFDRTVEEPVAAAIAVPPPPAVPLVVTEGNYLLLEDAPWPRVRAALDEVWYVDLDDATRVERLVRRHVEFGKPEPEARAWVLRSDEANAARVVAVRERADVIVRLRRG